MSNKIMDLAWETELPMTRKIVLVSLADQSNDRGESYPGLETIRRRCSMGIRTVYEALRELEDLGYLSRDQLPGSNTLYRIHLEKLQQQELPLRQAHPAAGARCRSRILRQSVIGPLRLPHL